MADKKQGGGANEVASLREILQGRRLIARRLHTIMRAGQWDRTESPTLLTNVGYLLDHSFGIVHDSHPRLRNYPGKSCPQYDVFFRDGNDSLVRLVVNRGEGNDSVITLWWPSFSQVPRAIREFLSISVDDCNDREKFRIGHSTENRSVIDQLLRSNRRLGGSFS